jgi:DNA-binding transcriptional LysR family regulator
MDIRLLREFLCLAEYLNFSEAARQLYIGQPALSRHIADLERQLGVQLFVRDKHSVRLTVVGEVVRAEAAALVARYEEALRKIRLAASGLSGRLRIGFLEKPVKKFFPALITEFRSAYPHVDLQLSQLNIGALTQALRRGDIDIGFTLSFDTPRPEGFSSRKIYADTLAVVVRKDHPLAGVDKIDLAALADEPFIFAAQEESPGIHKRVLDLCAASGFAPRVVQQYSFPDNALLMVETGIAVAVLCRHMEASASPELRFVEIAGGGASFDVVVTWRTDNSNPAVQPFLTVLGKVIGKDADGPLSKV